MKYIVIYTTTKNGDKIISFADDFEKEVMMYNRLWHLKGLIKVPEELRRIILEGFLTGLSPDLSLEIT